MHSGLDQLTIWADDSRALTVPSYLKQANPRKAMQWLNIFSKIFTRLSSLGRALQVASN